MGDYARDVRKELNALGWRFLRAGKGDHEIWCSADGQRKVTVDGKILSRHTANAILKQAGSSRKF